MDKNMVSPFSLKMYKYMLELVLSFRLSITI